MQTKILRGARRLLVTAGVITLACSVVAPAAVSASSAAADDAPGKPAEGPAIPAQARGNGLGDGEEPAEAQGAAKVWICHRTAADEANPWELNAVSENAVDTHLNHHDDWFLTDDDVAALEELLAVDLHQSALQQLDAGQLAALTASCAAKAVVVEDQGDGDQGAGQGNDDQGNNGDGDQGNNGDGDQGNDKGNEQGGDQGAGDEAGDQGAGDEGGDQGADDQGGDPQEPRGPKPIQVRDDEVTPPAAPPAPLPRPEISFDEVVAPPAQAPAVNPPAPAGDPEVLGVTTTRIPTRELASGAGVTSLPRTGTDSTTTLALVGGLLVAAGVGLEALGRRGHLAAVGGRR